MNLGIVVADFHAPFSFSFLEKEKSAPKRKRTGEFE